MSLARIVGSICDVVEPDVPTAPGVAAVPAPAVVPGCDPAGDEPLVPAAPGVDDAAPGVAAEAAPAALGSAAAAVVPALPGRRCGAACGFRIRIVRTEQRVQVRSDLRITGAPLDLRGDQFVEVGNELRHLRTGLAVQLRCGRQLRQLAEAVACGRQRTACGFFVNLRAGCAWTAEPAAGSLAVVPAAGVSAWARTGWSTRSRCTRWSARRARLATGRPLCAGGTLFRAGAHAGRR